MCLIDPNLPVASLDRETNGLRDDVQHCLDTTKAIQAEFATWRAMVKELSHAAAGEIHRSAVAAEAKQGDLERAKAEAAVIKNERAAYEKRMDELLKSSIAARDDYIKASKRQSAARDLGPATLAALFGTVQGTVNAALKIVESTPAMVMSVGGMLGAAVPGLPTPSQSSSAATADATNVSGTVQPAGHKPIYPDEGDLGYVYAERVVQQLSHLHVFLSDPDGLIERCRSHDSALHRCEAELRSSMETLQESRTTPSANAAECCRNGLDVLSQIRDYDLNSLSGPGEEWKKRVSHWKAQISTQKLNMQHMASKANFQPGQGFGTRAPLIRSIMSAGDGSFAQALHNANTRRAEHLQTASQTMISMQELYQKQTDKMLERQARSATLSASIANAASEKASLEQVRKVLTDTTEHVSKLQAELTHLEHYFQQMSVVVDGMHGRAKRLVDKVMDGVDRANDRATASYSDVHAQAIMIELFTLRGHFGLINDNAEFYCEMSQEHIMPTFRRISTTSLSLDAGPRQKAIMQLSKSAIEAADAITQRSKTYQVKLHERLGQRIVDAKAEMASLPSIAEARRLAIKADVKEISDTVIETIECNAEVDNAEIDDALYTLGMA